jgi:hypothetical protein
MTSFSFTYGWMIGLVIIAYVFPSETARYFNEMYAVAAIKFLNGRLLLQSWVIYKRLQRDFRRFGLEIPPFSFVPLQNR